TLHITDSGGRVAHLRSGRRFRLPGLHFACPDAAPSGCTASAEIWRVGRDGKPLRPAAAGEVALDAGERGDALVVRIGPATLRRLRARGRLTLLAHVTLRAAGASPATRVTRFRLVARLG
ncbi:MAG: hypothetical protein QOG63_302, partial [Thermoleophilaceae bacterium]|nr:hypothetical protein [Thermoleophilaceae bacterium]